MNYFNWKFESVIGEFLINNTGLYWNDFNALFWYAMTGGIVVIVLIGLALFINPPKYYDGKNAVYECGFKPFSWIADEIDVAFYRTGLIFLLFDIEVLLLLPWALNFFTISRTGHYTVLFIIVILLVGLIYELNSKALQFYPKSWNDEQNRAIEKKIKLNSANYCIVFGFLPSDIWNFLIKFSDVSIFFIVCIFVLIIKKAFSNTGFKQAIKEKKFITLFIFTFAPALGGIIVLPIIYGPVFFSWCKYYCLLGIKKINIIAVYFIDSFKAPYDVAYQINSLYNYYIETSSFLSVMQYVIKKLIYVFGNKLLLTEIFLVIALTGLLIYIKFFSKSKNKHDLFIWYSLFLLVCYLFLQCIITYILIKEKYFYKNLANPILEAFDTKSLLIFGIPHNVLTIIANCLTNYINYYIIVDVGSISLKLIAIFFFIICYIIYGFIITNYNKSITLEITYLYLIWGVIATIIVMCNNIFLLFMLFEITTLLLISFLGGYYLYNETDKLYSLAVYFVISLLSTAIILFGISILVFIVTNRGAFTLNFDTLTNFYLYDLQTFVIYGIDASKYTHYVTTAFKIIVVFLLVPFFFKLTLFPFAHWLVSIYEKIPTPFILSVLIFYKFIIVAVFFNLFINNFGNCELIDTGWKYTTILMCLSSLIGPYLAYESKNIISTFINLTIMQTGLVVIGIMIEIEEVKFYSLFSFITYLLHVVVLFCILLVFAKKFSCNVFLLDDLSKIIKNHRFYQFALASVLYSMIGLPIFGGFFTKYLLLLSIIKSGNYAFLFITLLALISQAIIYFAILQSVIDENKIKLVKEVVFSVFYRLKNIKKKDVGVEKLVKKTISSNNNSNNLKKNNKDEEVVNEYAYCWLNILLIFSVLMLIIVVWFGIFFLPILVKKLWLYYYLWRVG